MARFPTAEVAAALRDAALQTGIPVTLLMGVAFAESGFDPSITGPPTRTGERAQGLMQLMAATRERYHVTNGYDARQSALGGAKFLATLAKGMQWDRRAMLAAYNWGPGAYLRARADGQAPPQQVQRYVTKVLNAQHYYRTQAPRPAGTLMSALNAAIRNLAALNPTYEPATKALAAWKPFYTARQDDSDTAAMLNPALKRLWQAYADAYERAPLTDAGTPYPTEIEPDFWQTAAQAVDDASKAISEVASKAALGVGTGLFFVAVFLFAVSRTKRAVLDDR